MPAGVPHEEIGGKRLHRHRCPDCDFVWWCGSYQCWRTRYAETRRCHGSKCADLAHAKPAEPEQTIEPAQLDLPL